MLRSICHFVENLNREFQPMIADRLDDAFLKR
jgi:hypothetical protein